MRALPLLKRAAALTLSDDTERRPNIVMIAIDDLNNWISPMKRLRYPSFCLAALACSLLGATVHARSIK